MSVVQILHDPIDTSELGCTLAHEHIFVSSRGPSQDPRAQTSPFLT